MKVLSQYEEQYVSGGDLNAAWDGLLDGAMTGALIAGKSAGAGGFIAGAVGQLVGTIIGGVAGGGAGAVWPDPYAAGSGGLRKTFPRNYRLHLDLGRRQPVSTNR